MVQKSSTRRKFTAADLRQEVSSGKRVPFYLLHGDEDFERDNTCAWLVKALTPEVAPEFNVDVFHGDSFVLEDFLKVYQAYPMMASHRLVVLRGCEKIPGGSWTALDGILESPADTTLLVVSGGKVDLRRKFFAQLARKGRGVEFRVPFENQLSQWTQGYARQQGWKVESDAADLLRLYIGSNLRELASELGKLATFVGEGQPITRQAVEQAAGLPHSARIFDLTDAIGHQNQQRSLQLLHNLMEQGEDSGRAVAMISRHFRLLLKTQTLFNASLSREQIAARLGVAPFFLKGYLEQARKYPAQRLWDGLGGLLEADIRLKSLGRRQERLVVDLLVHRLCARPMPRGVDRR